MVIMDRQDYINKSNKLYILTRLQGDPQDPSNKTKTKLINILKRVESQTGLDNNTYKAMYPMGCWAPNSMVSLRSISQTHLSGLLSPAVYQLPMVWLAPGW